MRIPLAQPKNKPQAKLRRHSARGRKTRFDEAIAVKTHLPRRRIRTEATTPRKRRVEEPPAKGRGATTLPTSTIWSQFRQAVAVSWWALLILLLLLGGAAYASSDERFFVYDAEIVGAQHLDAQEVYLAAGVDKQSIFWIDPQRAAENIAGLQGVSAVHVRCDLPSSVTIRVEERQPVILWRSASQNRDWWLDAEGVILPYHGDPSAAGTVFVVDYSDRRLAVGDRIAPPGLAASVLEMTASLTGVRVFFYDAERGLFFTQQALNGEWPVYVGSSDDLARKIQVSELLNKHFEEKSIRPTYVDVRWASRPVYGISGVGDTAGGN